MSHSERWSTWAGLVLGSPIVLAYELRVLVLGRRAPHRVAREAHARMRADWVRALAEKPGFEIVAVQTLRNSLMSATISASTAALCMMGAVSLAGSQLAAGLHSLQASAFAPLELLGLALMGVLFGSFVCSALSMRYYTTTLQPRRLRAVPAGRHAAARGPGAAGHRLPDPGPGYLYGWGLRSFLMVAPLAAGIVSARG